jgi:UDP-2-acetamido-2,6-beta-L-arabino-hexul-4-ose reductase
VDPRGALVEIVRDLPPGAQVYVFTLAPGAIRGGHWHNRKREWFACVSGRATLVLEPESGRGERVALVLDDASRVVRVEPGTKHTFTSDTGATVLACISESFDPDDPDTFFTS